MSGPIYFQGTVDLKPGTTATQIMELADDYGIETSDEVILEIGRGELTYTVDFADGSWDFCDSFEGFLQDIAKLYSAAGWISFEGHEPDQAEVPRGPSPLAQALADLEWTEVKVQTAWLEHANALRRVRELQNV